MPRNSRADIRMRKGSDVILIEFWTFGLTLTLTFGCLGAITEMSKGAGVMKQLWHNGKNEVDL